MARTREQILTTRTRLRKDYGDLFDVIAAVLYRADPVGMNFGFNPDEYEPVAEAILPRLNSCKHEDDVLRVIHEEVVRWFSLQDVGPVARYRDVAFLLWRLWNERRAAGI
jgi:hypothetical protein